MKLFAQKFFIALILILVTSVFPITDSNAASPDPPQPPIELPEFAKNTFAEATLTEVNGGRRFMLTPVAREAVQDGANSYYVTYEVGIPREYLVDEQASDQLGHLFDFFPEIANAASDSHNGCDSTVSVCALLTLYYTQIGNHGYYQKATNKWTRYDSTVSWSNAKLIAGCLAEWYSGSGICNAKDTRNVGVPTSGTTYTKIPWFAGSSNQVWLNDLNGITAEQTIKLQRGVSSWTFAFCVSFEGAIVIQGCY